MLLNFYIESQSLVMVRGQDRISTKQAVVAFKKPITFLPLGVAEVGSHYHVGKAIA